MPPLRKAELSRPPIVSDEHEAEYMRARCGNIVQDPVINNVMTCEKCGEREYVG